MAVLSVSHVREGIIFNICLQADRDSPETRQAAVEALAARITALNPPDFFLDLHRRTV